MYTVEHQYSNTNTRTTKSPTKYTTSNANMVNVKSEIVVKNEPEDDNDHVIKTERAPVSPELEIEESVKAEEGATSPKVKKEDEQDEHLDAEHPKVKSEGSDPLVKATEQKQDTAVSGSNGKRKALFSPTSSSKKIKLEKPDVRANVEQKEAGPAARTRSKLKIKEEAGGGSPASPDSEPVSRQRDDHDEVEFVAARPVRRLVGSYVID